MRKEYPVDRAKITRPPTHPGVVLAEVMQTLLSRRTIDEIAQLLGVSRQTLHRVMAGDSAISADMALRLGKLCGNGPELWMNMQAGYDVWEAKQRLGKRIAKIPTLR